MQCGADGGDEILKLPPATICSGYRVDRKYRYSHLSREIKFKIN
jgi:hypothetical protein